MIGKYEIEVYNNRVHYFLNVKRNITVLQGNSASGKTELIRFIIWIQQRHLSPEKVITEDSNSGLEFFGILYKDICATAGGKSRIYSFIKKNNNDKLLVIVDGAAFGSEIGKIYRYLQTGIKNCVIYAPESFEYLILKSGAIDVKQDAIDNTYLYADSCKYMSWEEFYTAYLIDTTKDTVYRYSKSKLNDNYKTKGVYEKIVGVVPEVIRDIEWHTISNNIRNSDT